MVASPDLAGNVADDEVRGGVATVDGRKGATARYSSGERARRVLRDAVRLTGIRPVTIWSPETRRRRAPRRCVRARVGKVASARARTVKEMREEERLTEWLTRWPVVV